MIMSSIYLRELNLYKFSSLTLGVFILVVSAVGSLTLVWLRGEITETAQQTVALERELVAVERDNTHLASQIARAHQPQQLLARASDDLKPTAPGRVVWMSTNGKFPETLIAEARQNTSAVRGDSPLAISFDLALLNTHPPTR